MGDITRMSIAFETQSQLNPNYGPKLSKKRKREIRFNGIKRLIESKEVGHLFSIRELIDAAGYRVEKAGDGQYNSGWSFIKTLLDKGVIVRIDDGPNGGKYSYEVTNKSLHGRPIQNSVKKTVVELLSQREEERVVEESKDEPEEKTNTNPYPVSGDKCYSFKVTIQKRQTEDHGKLTVAELEMNDVSLEQIKAMVSQVVVNYEG